MPDARENRRRRARARRRLDRWKRARTLGRVLGGLDSLRALMWDAAMHGMFVVERRSDGTVRRVPPEEWASGPPPVRAWWAENGGHS